jgi:hypothetical protein
MRRLITPTQTQIQTQQLAVLLAMPSRMDESAVQRQTSYGVVFLARSTTSWANRKYVGSENWSEVECNPLTKVSNFRKMIRSAGSGICWASQICSDTLLKRTPTLKSAT